MGKRSPVERIEEALRDSKSEITDRDRLLTDLMRVRDLGFKKVEARNTQSSEKISWARLIVMSCSASDQILRSKEESDLLKRVQELERAIEGMNGVR